MTWNDRTEGREAEDRYASRTALARLEEQVRNLAQMVSKHEELLSGMANLPWKVDQIGIDLSKARKDINDRFQELRDQAKEATQIRVQRWSLVLGCIGAASTITGLAFAIVKALEGH